MIGVHTEANKPPEIYRPYLLDKESQFEVAMRDKEKYYSVEEVARLIGKSHMTVRRMIDQGKIPEEKRIGVGNPRPRLIPKQEFQALFPHLFEKKDQ